MIIFNKYLHLRGGQLLSLTSDSLIYSHQVSLYHDKDQVLIKCEVGNMLTTSMNIPSSPQTLWNRWQDCARLIPQSAKQLFSPGFAKQLQTDYMETKSENNTTLKQ